MAFTNMNSLNGRIDELRFPAVRSPEIEAPFTAGLTSPRDSNPFFSAIPPASNDVRGTLQRRFTTDSSKLPMGRNSTQYTTYGNSTNKQKQLYEDIQDARRKAQEQLALLDLQERNLQLSANNQDLERITKGFHRISLNAPVSEPTTPPDYSEDVFSNRFSRSSRVSANGLTSPPGLTKRVSQSSSKITSPPSNRHSNQNMYSSHRQSTKSMPGSRRGSDEDEYYPEDLPAIRSAASFNRFSMPVNGSRNQTRYSMGQTESTNGLGAIDTSFLLDEHERDVRNLTSPIAQAYAQLGGDDTFPTLTSDGVKLSANSAALDLANSKTPDNEWLIGSRVRPGHASMPHTDSSMYRPILSNISSPQNERPAELNRRKSQRHSMGVTFEEDTSMPPPLPTARPTSLQTSYSTNDVPTMKKSLGVDSIITPPKVQGDQHFHAHNVSMGRIPANGINNRQSRDLTSLNGAYRVEDKSLVPVQSGLQANATPFGPVTINGAESVATTVSSTSAAPYMNGPHNFTYNLATYNTSNPSGINGVGNGGLQIYPSQSMGPTMAPNMIGMMNAYGAYGKVQETPARAVGGGAGGAGARRHHDETRFNNVPLESYRNNLYELCKDQHGCRYLQRKLEDGLPDHIAMIFEETRPHIVELMTDPFGNYLCQKLFEHCNEEQRTALINAASPALTVIALNQHGTRALQKMIEFVNTPDQVDLIIRALSERVVELVQDLNGNHVIQKCLTRLGAERSQFIYDAVGNYCVVVGTHRHGCCVLQRCIDHAHGFQRAQLIGRITQCAFDLVQDPFGNYVVQYILDLDEMAFTKPLCASFKGRIVPLSKQKFSSNVIEKCLRTADMESKKEMIDEMMKGTELEGMLRDSFANYVVQTAMDYADTPTKMRIVEQVRPILPAIKQTPHGRRIAGKIMSVSEAQGRVSGTSSGAMTPTDSFGSGFSGGRSSNRRQVQIVGGGFNRPGYTNGGSGNEHDNQYQSHDSGYSSIATANGNYNLANGFNGNGFNTNGQSFNGFANTQFENNNYI